MKKTLLFVACALLLFTAKAQVTAAFSADEATVAYYTQGWDSQDEADTWTYQSTSSETWTLRSTPTTYGAVPFSTIDPASQLSLTLAYGSNQHETATSPELEIRPGSSLEFYCFANAGYLVFGAWKLYAIEGESSTLLLDQFQWAQDNAYDGARWVRFNIDLAYYAGKKVKFSFVYDGDYGEDEALDGFRLVQVDDSAPSITINEGESIHFRDTSTGATAWQWTFDGGTPATSTEQNPVVTYNTAGEYSVTLTASDGTNSNTLTRKAFIIVLAQPPLAHIGMPAEAYLSPFAAAFVPTGVPVQFRDLSTGNPTQWEWQFSGATPATSSEQNPIVTYPNKGLYSLMLTASNDKGSSEDAMIYAVQAGGAQYIWNIAPEENQNLAAIEMGWYGNYAGTNWLGMNEFAEHFDAPLAMGQIDSVAVYFAKTTAATADADITLCLRAADDNGMPGDILASSTMKASELVYDDQNVVETMFHLDNSVIVEDEFFVSIGGFPSNDGDDIAILLIRRNEGEKTTAYHYALDDDGTGWGYLETGQWFKSEDEAISLAIAPILSYDVTTTAIDDIKQHFGNDVFSLDGAQQVDIYDINGRLVASDVSSIDHMPRGIYIMRAVIDGQARSMKLVR